MQIPTTNDTGIHPAPGLMLVEELDTKTGGKIIIPDHIQTNDELKYLVCLEDARTSTFVNMNQPPLLAPGTRILCSEAKGVPILKGRKVFFVRPEHLLAWFDPAPLPSIKSPINIHDN